MSRRPWAGAAAHPTRSPPVFPCVSSRGLRRFRIGEQRVGLWDQTRLARLPLIFNPLLPKFQFQPHPDGCGGAFQRVQRHPLVFWIEHAVKL